MKRIVLFTFVVILAACGQAFSLEATLEQCIDLAMKHNSGLKSYEADTIAAQEETSMAIKDFLPSFRLLGNYSIVDKSPRLIVNRNAFVTGIPPIDSEVALGERNFYSLMLTVKQPLFTGGILTNTYRKSAAMSETSRHMYERQRRELTFEVKKIFYTVMNEQLAAQTMEKALQAKNERLRVLKELFSEGYISKEDVLRQETDTLFTELELLKSRNRAETARTQLKNLIHHTGNDELTLAGDSYNAVLSPPLDEVREAAVAHREELQSGRSRVKMAAADVAIARGGFYPHASLSGSFLQQKETNLTRPQVWMLTATVDWTIFEWGKTVNDVRRATAKKQREEYQLDDTLRNVALEAEQTWRQVKEGEIAVAANENNVRTLEYRLERDLIKFSEGKVKLADLLETESGFIKANNGYLAALNSLDTEFARLESVTATSLDTWTIPRPVYRPNVEAYSQKRNILAQQRKKSQPATAAALSQQPVNTPQETAVSKTAPPASQNTVHTDRNAEFVIQVGSFKSEKNAREVQNSILKNNKEHEIIILPVGNFYKVRIIGFATSADAENHAEQLGLTSYLIVRTGHEQRKTAEQ